LSFKLHSIYNSDTPQMCARHEARKGSSVLEMGGTRETRHIDIDFAWKRVEVLLE